MELPGFGEWPQRKDEVDILTCACIVNTSGDIY